MLADRFTKDNDLRRNPNADCDRELLVELECMDLAGNADGGFGGPRKIVGSTGAEPMSRNPFANADSAKVLTERSKENLQKDDRAVFP